MATFLVDTNFFLQCKAAAELPWAEVTSDPEVQLLVPEPVQEEIDRLKQDGSSRRSSRARTANSLFRRVLESTDLRLVIRDEGPRVVMSLVDRLQIDSVSGEGLDLAQADARILAAARVLNSQGQNVRVLTDDTGLLLSARRNAIPHVAIPEEGWQLPPEPDKRDKELAQARRELEALRRAAPLLTIAFEASGESLERAELFVVDYELVEAAVEAAVAEMRARYPLRTEFPGTPPGKPPVHGPFSGIPRWVPPTEAAIKQYTEEDYPKWLKSLARHFKAEVAHRAEGTRILKLKAVLQNLGTKPAENVVLDIRALGGIKLSPKSFGPPTKTAKMPSAPTPPTGEWVAHSPHLSSLYDSSRYAVGRDHLLGLGLNPLAGNLPVIPARDRYEFYWSPDAPSALEEKWRLECAEFRHQIDPRSFSIRIFVPDGCRVGPKAIEVRASASNMPAPLIAVLPVQIETSRVSAADLVEEMLAPGRLVIGTAG